MAVPPEELNPSELTVAAGEVVQAIDSLRQEIAGQKKYGRRNRSLIWIVAASVVLDLIISAGLVYLFDKTRDAAELAKQSSSAQVVSCRAGNETRAIQTDLWNTILAYPPPPGELPAAAVIREKRTAEFKDYITEAFKQQDCEKLVDP